MRVRYMYANKYISRAARFSLPCPVLMMDHCCIVKISLYTQVFMQFKETLPVMMETYAYRRL
jgi:hypothetical protein